MRIIITQKLTRLISLTKYTGSLFFLLGVVPFSVVPFDFVQWLQPYRHHCQALLDLTFWDRFWGQSAIDPAFQGRPGNLTLTVVVWFWETWTNRKGPSQYSTEGGAPASLVAAISYRCCFWSVSSQGTNFAQSWHTFISSLDLLAPNDIYICTGCFTTLGHNCRRWFPRVLW